MGHPIDQVVVRLRALANPPASAAALEHGQRAFGALPDDVRVFYENMDGTHDMTPVEQGAVRFWSLLEWKPVHQETNSSLYDDLASAPIVADYMIDSWWYALDCSPNSGTFGAVFLVDGAEPAVIVSPSFTEFLRAVLADDASLYPT